MGVIVTLTKGDTLVPVDFFLTDQNQVAIDVTNTSNNKFKMAPMGSMIDTVNANMTVQSAAGGVVRYNFTTPDLANANTYVGEIELNYVTGNASGRDVTARGITVIVGDEEPE